MSNWKSKNHSKFLLQYHLILVCKYRKNIFANKCIDNCIKQLSIEISTKYNIQIKYMESGKDHIHYMIETAPTICLSDFVKTFKSHITYHTWKEYSSILK